MLSYKVKLNFERKETRDFWMARMFVIRDCYNFVSKIIFDEKVDLNMKAVHAACYNKARQEFPNIPSQICIKIDNMVLANYRTAKSNKHNLTKPIVMKNPVLQLDKRLYSNYTRESFKIASETNYKRTLVKFETYPRFLELAEKFRMCDPLIQYKKKTREFYLVVPFYTTYTTQVNEEVLGIDLGCKRFVTTSKGDAYSDKNYLKVRRKIRYLKRILRSKFDKNHSNSAKKKLKKLSKHETNLSKNMCHHVANEILKNNSEGIIVLEDLTKLKQKTARFKNKKTKRTKHNNRLNQIPFYIFKQILSYKALLAGRQVATVSPSYTSQMDCRDGKRDNCIRKGCRFYTADGLVFDADWNAAINIAKRKRPISFSLPIDGRLNIIGRVCQRPNRGLVDSFESTICKPRTLQVRGS